jgi:RecA/RadA recombinase
MAKQSQKSAPATSDVRTLTPDQRAKLFLSARKEEKPDYQVLTKDWVDELVPYGLLTFDYVLGLGGISRHGRVSQVHGDEGVGKSTLTYVIAKNYQAFTGEPLGIFDFEGTGTPEYLSKIGADLNLVKLYQPDSTQDAVKETLRLLKQGCRFFIYDSIPDMQSIVDEKDIMSGKAFKANYGKHAQTMGTFFRLIQPYVKRADGHIFMINQTRARIDDSIEAQYANDYSYTNKTYVLPGGRICRFKPSVMVELRMVKAVTPIDKWDGKGPDKDPFIVPFETKQTEGKPMWNRVRARTLKNKVTGGGYREGYIWVEPGRGINDNMSVRELAREYGYIANKGAKWFVGKSAEEAIAAYPNKEAAVDDLVNKENPEVLSKLRALVAESIQNDNTGRHASAVTADEVRYMEGEDDGTEVGKTMDFEAEEV